MNNFDDLQQLYSEKPESYYGLERSELLPFIPDDSKMILDIGCSRGNFGGLLKRERNCEVWGVEPSKEAAQEAAQKLDKVINDTFSPDLAELQGVRFDTVCFNDVLEHLVNPEEMLELCKKVLTAQGSVIASIPNILFFPVLQRILIDQDWKYEDSGILDNTHLRFFTKKSIRRMFEKCGYEVVKIEGINPFADRRYKAVNLLFLNRLKDWKYMQFVVQAKIKSNV